MLAALQAIRDALAPLDYPVHLLSAEGPSDTEVPPVPYVVLAPANSTGLLPEELPACGPNGSLQFDLRVTAAGYPVDSPAKVQGRVRDVLSPALAGSRIITADRWIDVTYERTEIASQVDRDMFVTKVNRHPSYGVDSYTIRVQQLT